MNGKYINELTSNYVLIVFPGRHGREHVLKRIKDYYENIIILVDGNNILHTEWAKIYTNFWVECINIDYNDINNCLYDTICDFIQQNNNSLQIIGCFTYDDYGIEPTAFICNHLQLPYHSIDTVQGVRNKYEFRKLLANLNISGIKVCRSFIIHDLIELEKVLIDNMITYPIILKPTTGSGKYYVSKINTEEELRMKLNQYINTYKQLNEQISTYHNNYISVTNGWVIEDFVLGYEVDIDGYAINNQVQWMHVADNKPVDTYMRETGGYYPSQCLSTANIVTIKHLSKQCLEGIGGIHGCFHFEAIVDIDNNMMTPIELNLRIGGAECPTSIEIVSGVSLPIIAICIAINSNIPKPMLSYNPGIIVTTINIYAQHSGIIELYRGLSELYHDKDFMNAIFYQIENTDFLIAQGSMSLMCWIAVKGITKNDADKNLLRCINYCQLNGEL